MKNPFQKHALLGRVAGFTLTELLVVIAIVAVLATISVQVALKTRSKAMRVQTVGNLRSVATAFQAYLSEHHYTLPVGFQYGNEDRSAENWRDLLAGGGYLGEEDHNATANQSRGYEFSVMGSPLQHRNNPNQPRWDWATFGANSNVLGFFAADRPSESVKSHGFDFPAQTMLIAEGSTHGSDRFNPLIFGQNSRTLPDHLEDGIVSSAYLDGHVESMPLTQWPKISDAETGNAAWKFWYGRD